MKKVVLLLLFILLVGWASANPALKISLLNQDPNPVSPGQYVTLRFKIENFGDKALPNFYVKLVPKYPFIQDGADKNEKFLGTLWGGLSGNYGVVVEYKVRVADNAVVGDMPITLAYKYSDTDIWTQKDFNVHIRVVYNQVFVESIEQSPKVIAPGDTGTLSFKLKNYGDTTMHDITLMLGLQNSAIPLVPEDELSEKRIKTLEPGKEKTVTFNVKANPEAKEGLYKIGITLSYFDILNHKFTYSDVVGVPIGANPDLMVALESSSVYLIGGTGNVVIDLVNRGNTNIKFLTVHFKDTKGIKILGSRDQYIGNLDSDDFDTAKVKLHVTSNESVVPVNVEYSDALGNSYNKTVMIKIPIYSKEEALKYGFIKKSNLLGIIITLIIIAGGFIAYKVVKR